MLRASKNLIRGGGILIFATVDDLVLENYRTHFEADEANAGKPARTLEDLRQCGADDVLTCFMLT